MDIQLLTWIMTTVGFIGFIFVGQKKWWGWYINLVCQILWATYALATGQPAFLAFAAAYFVIFARNAYKWTKDHLAVKKVLKAMAENESGTHILPGGVEVTYEFVKDGKPVEDGMIIHNTKLDGSPVYTLPGDDSNLVKHARTELERIGEEPTVIDWYLRIIREYASFGHSGGSAGATAIVLEELLRFRPLGPLTNDPKEWIHHGKEVWGDPNSDGVWQNVRDSRAFSNDGGETYTLVDDPKGEDGEREVYVTACNLCEKRDPSTAVNERCLGCGRDYAERIRFDAAQTLH
jgi:hypothetical protein